ncbi:MAG: hypothetical protein IKH13_10740, partial [Clostridia bacterium]|nr:hypothetical protein [Clostridia bacterium]
LINKLMLTDEIKDVYSDPDFPQFHTSTNPSYSVFAQFDKSSEGFLSEDDTTLIVSNLTKQDYDLYVLNIESKGIDLDFDLLGLNKPIKENEKISVKFTGDLSSADSKVIEIAITYAVKGTYTPLGQRVLYFTVSDYNGAADDTSKLKELENDFGIFTSLVSGLISRILSLFKPIVKLFKSL